jgi:hypothetical protein
VHAGLPDGIFYKTKNTTLDTFGRALEWNMVAYFKAIWNILRLLGIFYAI